MAPMVLPSSLMGTQKKAIFWPLGTAFACLGQKPRVLADIRHHNLFARLHHQPGNPFAHLVGHVFLDSSVIPCATLILIISLSGLSSVMTPVQVSGGFPAISESIRASLQDSAIRQKPWPHRPAIPLPEQVFLPFKDTFPKPA